MTPTRPKRREATTELRRKTSLVLPESLWVRLKVAAAEERTDVSALLCRLAEDYLKSRKGGKR
jgi:predicted DNA-binding ribbon-helix-helix protein